MSAPLTRAYRFATRSQWDRCILHRFDAGKLEGLAQVTRIGSRARQEVRDKSVSAVAFDRFGGPFIRIEMRPGNGSPPQLMVRDSSGAFSRPIEIDAQLAQSPRWSIDRHWFWVFGVESTLAYRYERETLQQDMVIDVTALGTDGELSDHLIVDLVSDGCGGAWILSRRGADVAALVHIDCVGCGRGRVIVPRAAVGAQQIGMVGGGKTLVLLGNDGRCLWFVPTDGKTGYTRSLDDFAVGYRATRIATDSRNRVALGAQSDDAFAIILLDGSGDLLDGPIDPFPNAAPSSPDRDVNDIAVSADVVWIARADGLWRLDSTIECGPRESESVVLTPALVSPEDGAHRGWLRAELDVDLPTGAVLSAEYATTSDARVAERVRRIGDDPSTSASVKQQRIWAELDPPTAEAFRISAPVMRNQPVAIPLIARPGRWLWLRLALLTPPGTEAASLAELRVLYPERSLMERLPAVFRTATGDAGGVLRRLVGAIEVTTQGIDEKIRRIGSQIDPETAPDEWLDYIAQWLDLPWDDALPARAKRCILQNAGALLAERGTRSGLQRLVRCLIGSGGVRIWDLTVDYPPLRLGGPHCVGGSLPALLAGVSRGTAALGDKAVLGVARLGCPGATSRPLDSIVPTVLITVSATHETQREIKPLLADVVGKYIPAGVKLTVAWQLRPDSAASRANEDALMVLDADGPGALGTDSVLGRTVLAGHRRSVIGSAGVDSGFHL